MRNRAARARAAALIEMSRISDTDPARVLPWLLSHRQEDPALGAIRLWRVDRIMFHVSEPAAKRTVEQAARWAGRTVKGGYPDVDWLLAWHGLRLNCWLLAMSSRSAAIPGPNPWDFTADERPASQG